MLTAQVYLSCLQEAVESGKSMALGLISLEFKWWSWFFFFYLFCCSKIQPVDHGAYNFLLQMYCHKVSEKPGVNHPPKSHFKLFLKKRTDAGAKKTVCKIKNHSPVLYNLRGKHSRVGSASLYWCPRAVIQNCNLFCLMGDCRCGFVSLSQDPGSRTPGRAAFLPDSAFVWVCLSCIPNEYVGWYQQTFPRRPSLQHACVTFAG